MHIESALAKRSIPRSSYVKSTGSYVQCRGLQADDASQGRQAVNLGDVFAANGELLGRLDAHLDAPAGTAQQGDQDRAVGEELRQRHAGIHAVRRLDDDRLIGAAAQDQHRSCPRQRTQRFGEGLSLGV